MKACQSQNGPAFVVTISVTGQFLEFCYKINLWLKSHTWIENYIVFKACVVINNCRARQDWLQISRLCTIHFSDNENWLSFGINVEENLKSFVNADSHKLRLPHAAAAESCIATAEIENFLFFACTLLPYPYTSTAAHVNQPLKLH